MTTADKIIRFLRRLDLDTATEDGIEVLNPYQDKATFSLCRRFFKQYYDDDMPRSIILGINPGRHGAGLTGIPFTDPVKLEKICGIANDLPKKTELSADFIYQMISVYGGPEGFYKNFYFSSVSPLGFTKDGKNLNYYDTKALAQKILPFIVSSIQETIRLCKRRDICYCLGEGQNFRFLNQLNLEHHFFERLVPLPHPRFIMQYRRKKVDAYIKRYIDALNQ